MTFDLTIVFEALITLVTAIALVFVIPLIRQKIGSGNTADFLRWVEIAVAAAEQLYNATDTTAKKTHVVKFLEKKGYTVDTEDLDNAIEAAVRKLHHELYGSEPVKVPTIEE